MNTVPITSEDEELIEAAEELLKKHFKEGRYRCSAAIRTDSGNIYTGINLITGGQADVHSEPIALGRAVLADDPIVETSVAVRYEDDDASNQMYIASACGVCRELYNTFAPDVDIIISENNVPMKAPLSELLPAKI